MTPPQGTVKFRCTCGRTVVTQAGTDADADRRCTRCRIRALRRLPGLVRER
jgi:DNA-directed RNA polymerase subunit RPC12/RpoP